VSAQSPLRDWLRSLLFENFWLKVFSLLCAVALYAFFHGAESGDRTVKVGVVVLPAPADRTLLNELPNQVTVILRGPRTQVDAIKDYELGAFQIDLRSGRGSRAELNVANLRLPTGVTVDRMYPSSVEMRWDDVIEKEIPIQVSRTGEPAPGLTVKGAIQVNPSQVKVRGPRSVLNIMQLVRTSPFDVSVLSEGIHKQQLALDRPPALDTSQPLVSYDVDTVNATVEISRRLVARELPKLKVQVVGLLHVTPQPPVVEVKVIGTAEDVNAVDPEALVARVEPKAAGLDVTKPGSAYLDVLVDAPKVTVEVIPSKVFLQW
jgi:YbbR domain-containing protein